jgi:hypothetical protein
MSPCIRRFTVLFLFAPLALAASPSTRGDDSPTVPIAITIKLGDVKLFPVNNQGKVLLTNSDPCRCTADVLGKAGTKNGVLFIPLIAAIEPVEVTVSSDQSLEVYRITVSASDPSTTSPKEIKLQEVSLQPGDSQVYAFGLPGPVGTLVTHTHAVSACLLGDDDTQRGMRIVGLHHGHCYVAVAPGARDLKLFKFTVK